MIIQCDKCHTRFRLDDSRIGGKGVKIRCTKCQNVFVVMPPPEPDEVEVEEVFGIGAQARPRQEKPPLRAIPKADEKVNLQFDFARAGEKKPPAGTEKGDRLSFDDIDFSFASKKPVQEPGADAPESSVEKAAGEGDFDLGGAEHEKADRRAGLVAEDSGEDAGFFEGEPKREEDAAAGADFGGFDERAGAAEEKPEAALPEGDWGLGGLGGEKDEDFGAPPVVPEDTAVETRSAGTTEDAVSEKPAQPAEHVVPFSIGVGKGEAEEEAQGLGAEVDKSPFAEALSDALRKDDSELAPVDEGEEVAEAGEEGSAGFSRREPGSFAFIVPIIIFILLTAVVHFSGAADRLTGALLKPSPRAEAKPVMLEGVRGFFAVNRNFGSLFVIEGRLKNITDEAQGVKSVRGIIYNSGGSAIAARAVSPGRVVSAEDIKNLSEEDLLRQFKEASGGIIPPRGSIPVMVLFTRAPEGMAEFGMEVAL